MSSLVPHSTSSLFSAQQPEWSCKRKRRPCHASGLSSSGASSHLWWNPKFLECLFGFRVTWALPDCPIFFSFSLCVAEVAFFLVTTTLPHTPPPPTPYHRPPTPHFQLRPLPLHFFWPGILSSQVCVWLALFRSLLTCHLRELSSPDHSVLNITSSPYSLSATCFTFLLGPYYKLLNYIADWHLLCVPC